MMFHGSFCLRGTLAQSQLADRSSVDSQIAMVPPGSLWVDKSMLLQRGLDGDVNMIFLYFIVSNIIYNNGGISRNIVMLWT